MRKTPETILRQPSSQLDEPCSSLSELSWCFLFTDEAQYFSGGSGIFPEAAEITVGGYDTDYVDVRRLHILPGILLDPVINLVVLSFSGNMDIEYTGSDYTLIPG